MCADRSDIQGLATGKLSKVVNWPILQGLFHVCRRAAPVDRYAASMRGLAGDTLIGARRGESLMVNG